MKRWILEKGDRKKISEVAQKYRISNFAASLLILKMSDENFNAQEFLSDNGTISDPFLIKDMDKAVARLKKAVSSQEKICIYGDYDADGVSATTIMYKYLKKIGANVIYYIPNRFSEGYGMNNNAVKKLKDMGVQLILTVDNGISAYEQIQLANSLGMETIITDHHTVPEKMPNAVAIVDPHRQDDNSPFEHFCGAGLALKLVMAMEGKNCNIEKIFDEYGAVCALATVADVVSLTGENRTIVKKGLVRINNNSDSGIAVLRKKSSLENTLINSTHIGFELAPRINAAGRLENADQAVEMLVDNNLDKVEEIASHICTLNSNRKNMKEEMVAEAIEIINNDSNIRNRKVLVVAKENWHEGVLGLAASGLCEYYGKPAIVISISGDKAKGSARSIQGYPMDKAVTYCKDLLNVFGGHPMAAGMSLPKDNIDSFREKLNEYADTLDDEFLPVLKIANKLVPGKITPAQIESADIMEPCGEGNPAPLFAYTGVTIEDVVPIKDGKFVWIFVKQGSGQKIKTVCFSYSYSDFPYREGDVVDLAVEIGINEYKGNISVDSKVKDIKISNIDNIVYMRSRRIFEEYMAGKPVTDSVRKELKITKQSFNIIYTYIKEHQGNIFPEMMYYRLSEQADFSFGGMLLAIEILAQSQLIKCKYLGQMMNISIVPVSQKVDIMNSPLILNLQ